MISRFFIERPIFANVIALVTVLIGAVFIYGLPIAQYPEIVPPTIQVSTRYPGASAEVVAATYDGDRGHPVLLARAVWGRVPDEGARPLPALLVPCEDLGPPGDVDFADELPERFKPPAAE